jgi:outer membrane receptor protein involved in Fe transport
LNFTYDFTDNLSASLQLGADVQSEAVKRTGAIVQYLPGSPQDLAAANKVVGAVSETRRTDKLYDTYFTLNHNAEVKDFTINSALGVGYNEKNGTFLGASVTDLHLPNFYELSNSATTPIIGQSDYKSRYYFVFASAEIGYKDKYFLTATGRNDWTSTLPIGSNSYFYPSLGASAIVLQGGSFLKLRASWAQAGKDASAYNVYSTVAQSSNDGYFGSLNFPFGGANSYEIGSRLSNEDLVNELTTEYEAGLEARFFRNRLNFDVAVYDRTTDDMLINKVLPRSTGYSTKLGNFASIRNRGVEFMMDTYPIKTKDFQWNMTYTFTKNKSKVLDIAGADTELTYNSSYGVALKFVEGESYGSFYAFNTKQNAAGQYIVNADTGFYEVSDKQEKVASAERDFIMGLQNKFTYKNLSLGIGLDWKEGGSMYSYTKRLSHFVGNGIETTYNDRNPFIIPNSVIDNGNGTYSENTTPVGFGDVTNLICKTNEGIK